MGLGVTRKDKIRNEYVRGTAKIAKIGDKLWYARQHGMDYAGMDT